MQSRHMYEDVRSVGCISYIDIERDGAPVRLTATVIASCPDKVSERRAHFMSKQEELNTHTCNILPYKAI